MNWKTRKIFLFLALILASCAPTREVTFEPGKEMRYREVGVASWYGEDFHGRRTANGEIYDMYSMTAAHRTLPFNLRVLVTNLENGKKAEFRINDRGPFISGRIIDLSKSGARELGMLGPGTARVAVEAAGWAPGNSPEEQGVYAIQVGSFLEKQNAYRLRDDLTRKYSRVHVVIWESNNGRYYRVRLGSFRTEEEARRSFEDLRRQNLSGFIVREE